MGSWKIIIILVLSLFAALAARAAVANETIVATTPHIHLSIDDLNGVMPRLVE